MANTPPNCPQTPGGFEPTLVSAPLSPNKIPEPTSPVELAAIDARQEKLMERDSSDGRPPPRRLRNAEWLVLAAVGALAVLCASVWVLTHGVDGMTVVGVIALTAVLFGATSPVWGAGLLRGKEERAARERAQAQVRGPRTVR